MKVAVAVIYDKQRRVLITRRSLQTTHGGRWEFPGGKLEKGELAATALVREIKEELGIIVKKSRFLGEVNYFCEPSGSLVPSSVQLLIYIVIEYQGIPRCCELQMDLRWVGLAELNQFDFPPANQQIIKLIEADKIHSNMV